MDVEQQTKLHEIKKLLIGFAAYLDIPIKDFQIDMYAEDLLEIEPEEVGSAIVRMRKERRWMKFPLPVEIFEYAGHEKTSLEDEANMFVGKVLSWIKEYGYYKADELKANCTKLEWLIIKRFGGWTEICKQTNDQNIGIVRAQLRNLALAHIRRSEQQKLLPSYQRLIKLKDMNKLLEIK